MLSAKEVLQISNIVPVISVESSDEMLYLADALLAGGVSVFEITLRTPAAFDAIKEALRRFPQATVGAGTVRNTETFKAVEDTGAKFAISPGLSDSLAKVAIDSHMPLIPGTATASEIMSANDYGFYELKLFPATIVGGVPALKAYGSVFKDSLFCPTGGISLENAKSFLDLKNVVCVGGSWIVSPELIKAKKFDEITKLTTQAVELLS